MPKCCVPSCRSHPRKKEVSFYRIPAIKTNDRSTSLEQFTKKRNAWLKALRLEDIENVKNPRVCSLHFHSGKPSSGFDESDPDWAPSLRINGETGSTESVARFQRRCNRSFKNMDTGYIHELPLTVQNSPVTVGRNASFQSTSQSSDNSAESALDNTIEPIQINMASISQGPNGDHISDIDDVHVPVDDNISEAQSDLIKSLRAKIGGRRRKFRDGDGTYYDRDYMVANLNDYSDLVRPFDCALPLKRFRFPVGTADHLLSKPSRYYTSKSLEILVQRNLRPSPCTDLDFDTEGETVTSLLRFGTTETTVGRVTNWSSTDDVPDVSEGSRDDIVPDEDIFYVEDGHECKFRKLVDKLAKEVDGLKLERDKALDALREQNEVIRDLKEKNQSSLELFKRQKNHNIIEEISKNDAAANFYTGLHTYKKVMAVFELCNVKDEKKKCSLSCFEQFILTLMKMRLNLRIEDVAYRFNVSAATASRIFNKWVDVMHDKLPTMFLRWPSRSLIQKTMPNCFADKYDCCVVIIDGFEIRVEVPENKKDQASLYSSYKHHTTVKFLIGTTPQGSISFISKGFTGRTSDRETVIRSGILNYLSAGDVVLADRGFTVEELIGSRGAKLVTPTFKGKRDQLTGREVEHSRRVSNVRIHVERVIGNLRKKFTIIRGTVPMRHVCHVNEDLTMIDKIVRVCCCLHNVTPGVVPFD